MNIRRSIFIIAAALSLLSCSKQEVVVVPVPVNEYEPIEFKSYLERSSSLTKADAPNPLGEGARFNMKAYYNHDSISERFYSCVSYFWNGAYFISSPVYYWPVNGTLDFYAVSPEATHDSSETILPDKTVTITGLDGATDLLAASLLGASRTDASHKLVFGHKLTKIIFKAIGQDTSLKYEITSLTLKASPDAIYSFAQSNSAESWTTATGTPKTYTYSIKNGTIAHGTTQAQLLGAEGYGLTLLPSQPSSEGSVLLTVSYKAYHKAGDGSEVSVHEGTHEVDLTSSATAGATAWNINRAVTYTLNLKPGDPVTFSAIVGEWIDAEETNGLIVQ